MSITNTTVYNPVMFPCSNVDTYIDKAPENTRENTAHDINCISAKPIEIRAGAEGNDMINIASENAPYITANANNGITAMLYAITTGSDGNAEI